MSPALLRTAAVLTTLALTAACGETSAVSEDQPPSPPTAATTTSDPVPRPTCPESGVLVVEGSRDAALGLRALALRAVVCGPGPVRVQGYPQVSVLDARGRPLEVRVVKSTDAVDGPPPSSFDLDSGDSASFSLVWRGTVEDVARPPVTSRLVSVAVGDTRYRVPLSAPGLDLGTSPRLEVTAWQRG